MFHSGTMRQLHMCMGFCGHNKIAYFPSSVTSLCKGQFMALCGLLKVMYSLIASDNRYKLNACLKRRSGNPFV